MKSNRQRRAEIKAARVRRNRKAISARAGPHLFPAGSMATVDETALLPTNSCGIPAWQARGHYCDIALVCKDCGAHGIWTAARQKWWYERCKGHPESVAVRCKSCRIRERARKAAAREIAQAGPTTNQEAK
ncbi:MAG: zinc-ribbon domain containing protein [Rhodocyclaceae bacterium]|nr:zinc-ribbon domain containing protein [Rhodocyclaceae bacterium]